MTSTYTPNNLLELMGIGDQSGTWGNTTNTMISTVDRLTKGVGSKVMSGSGDQITTIQGTISVGHYLVLLLTGTLSTGADLEITPNTQSKFFFITNNSGATVEVFQGTKGSASTVSISNTKSVVLYAAGSGTTSAVVDIASSLNEVGSSIQAFNNFLNNMATTGIAVDQMIYGTGTNTVAATALTSFARSLLDDADAATFLTTLGLPTVAQLNYNAISTLGTSEANKVLTANGSNDVIIGNDLTVVGELKAASYNETYSSLSSVSNVTTANLETANVFKTILTEATTFSFTFPPASGTSNAFTLIVQQDSGSNFYGVIWPSSVKWTRSLTPALTNVAGAVDIFVFFTVDAGVNYYGFTAGQNMG